MIALKHKLLASFKPRYAHALLLHSFMPRIPFPMCLRAHEQQHDLYKQVINE